LIDRPPAFRAPLFASRASLFIPQVAQDVAPK
jgi:hypothetical protein